MRLSASPPPADPSEIWRGRGGHLRTSCSSSAGSVRRSMIRPRLNRCGIISAQERNAALALATTTPTSQQAWDGKERSSHQKAHGDLQGLCNHSCHEQVRVAIDSLFGGPEASSIYHQFGGGIIIGITALVVKHNSEHTIRIPITGILLNKRGLFHHFSSFQFISVHFDRQDQERLISCSGAG